MPEGDTIFRAARTLARALTGGRITRFETGYAQLAAVDDQAPMVGRTVERVWAEGKHLYMALSAGADEHGVETGRAVVLHTHMRMNGSWHIYRPGEPWQRAAHNARVVLGTEQFVAVAFDVPVAEFQTPRQQERQAAQLGPDLLKAGFTEADAVEARRRIRARPELDLAAALLHQGLVAGIGNVYKSEVLFLEGLNPQTPVAQVTEAQLDAILLRARQLLALNVKEDSPDGIVTYRGMRRTTRSSDPAERLWVYSRGGEPCRRCGATIQFYKQGEGARSTYFCPRCQPVPARPSS